MSRILESGALSFTIESRILRELGERLVKQPEVALLELVKNAYDADAETCEIKHEPPDRIVVSDDGHGMTVDEFKNGWMRVGTSSKEALSHSLIFRRVITGEKGIGRFAVRFLGTKLSLKSVASDKIRGLQTVLMADFDWPRFDRTEDLGRISVPYELASTNDETPCGTQLVITSLRSNTAELRLRDVLTASINVVTPYRSMLRRFAGTTLGEIPSGSRSERNDPGFSLKIEPALGDFDDGDLATAVLDNFVLKAVVRLKRNRLKLNVYRRGLEKPTLAIVDAYENTIGSLYADIRFFPNRKGTFSNLPIDGRRAKIWVKENSGVAVFDRTFRVHPYGLGWDDWLFLSADTARRAREPRSSIAQKHFPMNESTRMSTQLNYMLRLPYSQQLVGIVQVEGRRNVDSSEMDEGLIAAADREGFVDNDAFRQLRDVIRGAVEALASSDRELQIEQERAKQEELLETLRIETQEAISEIEANANIPRTERALIVKRLLQAQILAEQHEKRSREQLATLEVMSLLGVVAGFMTHEFGAAITTLNEAQKTIQRIAGTDKVLKAAAAEIENHIGDLRQFVTYSQGYVRGTSPRPKRSYLARPRFRQVKRIFGKYATERGISIGIDIDAELKAPLVPVSLYNGIALNLFSNALKAIAVKSGNTMRQIVFRAWNERQNHYLEVCDTGVGIPSSLRHRVFDPLFTTTASNLDPLGSGMGLGLTLVKRGVEAYGGRVDVVDPPPGFTTCVRVRLPLSKE